MVNKNTFKDIQKRSSETIAEELSRLREYSEQNNINEVNNLVKSLLSNPGVQNLQEVAFLLEKLKPWMVLT
jgi:cytochrome c553